MSGVYLFFFSPGKTCPLLWGADQSVPAIRYWYSRKKVLLFSFWNIFFN